MMTLRPRTARVLPRAMPAAALALLLVGPALGQVQPVDRGTADLGPNSASQRVVHPGIGQFSADAALTDRFADGPTTQLADLYAQQRAERRYLYRAPGVAAMYNQSDYLTQDSTGLVGLNGVNAGNGRMLAITPADVVYVLSPELLDARPRRVYDDTPRPGQVDHRLHPQPITYAPGNIGPDGRLTTQVDGRYDPDRPNVVDIEAINNQLRGAQRDPRLVERARQWREEREREEAAAEKETEATNENGEPDTSDTPAPNTDMPNDGD